MGVTDQPLLAVAHRAGNNLADLRAAVAAGVDLIEADVHLFGGVLELRHAKALGRRHLWEPWRELTHRRDVDVARLDVLLAAAGPAHLMLDLKGPYRTLAPRVATVLREWAPRVPVTVCSRHWGMLDAFADQPHIRRVHSAGSRRQLARLGVLAARRPVAGMSIRLDLLTAPVVADLRRHTDLIMAWPVDTEDALRRARAVGATGIISKNLSLLQSLAAR